MRILATPLALVALFAQPLQAATCWEQPLVEAAMVKQYDIMLMVSTLRCQANGDDFSPAYNNFVISKRAVIKAAGGELQKKLAQMVGARKASNAYDSLGVTMANMFGNGKDVLGCARARTLINEATAAEPSKDRLVWYAQRIGIGPSIPATSCMTPFLAVTASHVDQIWPPLVDNRFVGVTAGPPPMLRDEKGKMYKYKTRR